ncbi:cell adhesion molecule Dscam2 isoform X1 [Bemisia tabaci]
MSTASVSPTNLSRATFLLVLLYIKSLAGSLLYIGPSFFKEPPPQADFANDTGVRLDCAAGGSPVPSVSWLYGDGKPVNPIPQILELLPNGSIHFLPFAPSSYRIDVHSNTYRCQAANLVGRIVSRDVRVRAVVLQAYELMVEYSNTAVRGSTVFLRCTAPSFVRDFITITSWVQDSAFNIYPSIKGDGKYHMLPSGELLIRKITDADRYKEYQCRGVNKLSGVSLVSSNTARFTVTDVGLSLPRSPRRSTTIYARKDQPTVLPCFSEGFVSPTYRWFREDSPDRGPKDDRILQIEERLIIQHVEAEDDGVWICEVNGTSGSGPGASGVVEQLRVALVVRTPLAVTLSPGGEVTVDVGSRLAVRCLVGGGRGHLSRTWLRNGQAVGPATAPHVAATQDTLVVERVKKEDAGMYQCVAKTDEESAQAAVQLMLGAAQPQLLYKFIQQTLQPGPPVSLKCIASGNPTPQITWKLDGFPLPQTERFVMGQYVSLHGDVISHVNISSVQVQDGGIYQCTAVNKVGEISHSAEMRVYGLPFVRPMPNISAVAEEPLFIACPVAGYPIDSITWEKEGKKLPLNRRQHVFSNGTLMIKNVQREADKGFYSCTAENKQGRSSSESLYMNVIAPPKIGPINFGEVVEGVRTQVPCVIQSGDLPLSIQWLKDDQPIPLQLNIQIRKDDEYSSSLIIPKVGREHSGNYTCVASNPGKSSSVLASLVVSVPPRWLLEPRDLNVTRGSPAVLDCQAEGFPTPTSTWRKVLGNQPGEYQDLSVRSRGIELLGNGTLYIRQTLPEHQGLYLCEAVNGIGAGISATISLIIHNPPQFSLQSSQVSARRGAPQTLQCHAHGDQPLTITWSRDNALPHLQFNPRYEVKEEKVKGGTVSDLVIDGTTKADAGTFLCTASNPYGRSQRTIHLQVQDAPGRPRDVHVVQSDSRNLKISWSPPLDSQTIALQYTVLYRKEQGTDDEWISQSVNSELSVTIQNLNPAVVYSVKIVAENELGAGEPSEIITVKTEAEPPAKEPQDIRVEAVASDKLKLTWTAPERELWNGEILGYYVGYREYGFGRPSSYNFTTIPAVYGSTSSAVLSGLKKFRKYGVVVQAFNEKGPGPMSSEVLAQTLEDVPSAPPDDISCESLSSQSIAIQWRPPPQLFQNGHIQGYKLYYESMEEPPMPGHIEAETLQLTATSAEIHNLQKYTNYSIQVWAFTKIGDGVRSKQVFCFTNEDVPEAPSGVKVLPSSSTSLTLSWAAPQKANGKLTSYTVYYRILSSGHEIDSLKRRFPPTHTFYQFHDFKAGLTYEFWVTAFTKVGEGQSTQAVYGSVSNKVPAGIVSFGKNVHSKIHSLVRLPCIAVGIPAPKRSWLKPDGSSTLENEDFFEISQAQKHHQGNYTCSAFNVDGSDRITYSLHILVPPSAPEIRVRSSGTSWIQIEWSVADTGGSAIRGFILTYRQEGLGEASEVYISRDANSYQLDSLQCGVEYQLQLLAYNNIGQGKPCPVLTAKTDGWKPVKPSHVEFIDANTTSVTLYLKAWNPNGCPIVNFKIEYKEPVHSDWMTVGSHVGMNTVTIPNLWPGTLYHLRVTAENSAGMTLAEYSVSTLSTLGGTFSPDSVRYNTQDGSNFSMEFGSLLPVFLCAVVFTVFAASIALCLHRKRVHEGDMHRRHSTSHTSDILENKQNMSQREQYYAAIRKGLSPGRDLQSMERLPVVRDRISSPAYMESFLYPDHRLANMETLQLKSSNRGEREYARIKGGKYNGSEPDYSGSTTDQYSELGVNTRDRIPQTITYPESSSSPEPSPLMERRSRWSKPHVRRDESSDFSLSAHLAPPPCGFTDMNEHSEAECDISTVGKLKVFKKKIHRSSKSSLSSQKPLFSTEEHNFTIAV